ncbi:MAG: FAD/NAD(P)-binding oxidoreductase [Rhizobiaceae bacterium]
MTETFVVLGNGAAGQTAAERIRALKAESKIVLISAERHPHYSRVALPRYVRGQIAEDKVFMRSMKTYAEYDIDFRPGLTATAIDARERFVQTSDGHSTRYDKLLIATGGRPKRSPWEIEELPESSMAFQTVDDARRIIARSDEARNVLVVGGGFIGYELAEGIAFRNKAKVTWLMRGPWFLSNILDQQAGAICKDLGEQAGVNMIDSDQIRSVEKVGEVFRVSTMTGHRFEVDLIAQGIGIDYHIEAAISAGLVGEPGIRTNSRLRTKIPDIFAAGDIALFEDEGARRYRQTGTWDSAMAQGKIAADNMAGGNQPFQEVATYTTTMFGSTIAVLGDVGRDAAGAETITVVGEDGRQYRKLCFHDRRLVGAVIIGPPKGRKKLLEMIRSREELEGKPESVLASLPA